MENFDNEKLFAIKLADNEKKVRDKSISQLRNYINSRCVSNGNFLFDFVQKLNFLIHFFLCSRSI
jgi:hypothetical protein